MLLNLAKQMCKESAMLRESLIEATQFFAKDVLASEVSLFESCPMGSFYAAQIAIQGDANYQIAVYINKESLVKMAYLFLFEENPDEATLTDLIKEIANLIVGKAKVIAAAGGLNFDISTPDFISDNTSVSENDLEINFMFEDQVFSIAAKAKA